MNDAVDRVLAEREAMDAGFSGGLVLSGAAHGFAVAFLAIVAYFSPHEPLIKIADGFAAAAPRGGRGTPTTEPPAPAQKPAPAPTAAPEPVQPPRQEIKKPPKDDARKGLPELDAKRSKKPERTPPPVPSSTGIGAGGGKSAQTPGFEWAPEGIGLPDGTSLESDWYLASVQQRIWALWMQQVKTGMQEAVTVAFTIQADGSVTDIKVVQSSGAVLLDLAAQRAITSAAPFGPLPKNYGTNRITIQGVFKPAA